MVIEQLRRIREIIQVGHTTGTFARDSDGNPCRAESSYAVCWCIAGAVQKEASERNDRAGAVSAAHAASWRLLERATKALGGLDPVGFNDGLKQEGVLRLVDKAIELGEKDGNLEEG